MHLYVDHTGRVYRCTARNPEIRALSLRLQQGRRRLDRDD